jgi:hypothetical protein
MDWIEHILIFLTITMGLCLMWEGYSDLAESAPRDTTGLSEFVISSITASGGNSIRATLVFSDLTPVNGVVVRMTSTDPSAVPVTDVPVPAAIKSWQLFIPTNPVSQAKNVRVTASYAGIKRSAVVTVQ